MIQRSVHNYSIADFLELRSAKRLKINRDFQRRSVWQPAARVYLIDSILRGYPVPKMYFRSTVDPRTQSSVREVVDGQQRLLAIFEFADDRLKLTSRAGDLAGLRYSDLDEEQQSDFLAYTFVAEQLINASDSEVLEVFARINTYTASLTPAELRHAKYQGEFKWLVHELSREWQDFWEEHSVLSLGQRARMVDDQLTADMLLQVLQGPIGGETKTLDRAYKTLDDGVPEGAEARAIFEDTLRTLQDKMPEVLEPPLSRAPHLLVIFAAAAHVLHGIGIAPVDGLPQMEDIPEPPSAPSSQDDWDTIRDRLLELGEVIDESEAPDDTQLAGFWDASRARPINLVSRKIRFARYLEAFDLD